MLGNLTLRTGNILGTQLRSGQIISYCGLPTPEFYTAEMGYRNLRLGMEGHPTDEWREFKPWQWEQVSPIASALHNVVLPQTFRDLVREIQNLRSEESSDVHFVHVESCFGQNGGYILVRNKRVNPSPISRLSQGVPILQDLVSRGVINRMVAVGILKRMVNAGITEEVNDYFFKETRERSRISRFQWETYTARNLIELSASFES